MLALKVLLKRKLSSSPPPDKGKEIRLISSDWEIPQPRVLRSREPEKPHTSSASAQVGKGQNGWEPERPLPWQDGGVGSPGQARPGQHPCPQMGLTQCPLGARSLQGLPASWLWQPLAPPCPRTPSSFLHASPTSTGYSPQAWTPANSVWMQFSPKPFSEDRWKLSGP